MRHRQKNNPTALLSKQNPNTDRQNSFYDAGSNQPQRKENPYCHTGQNVGVTAYDSEIHRYC